MNASNRSLLALAAVGIAATSQADISDCTDVTNGLEMTITGYACGVGNEVVVTPDTIDGFPVTSIGDNAFRWCDALTSVTISDNVLTPVEKCGGKRGGL